MNRQRSDSTTRLGRTIFAWGNEESKLKEFLHIAKSASLSSSAPPSSPPSPLSPFVRKGAHIL